MRTPRGNVHDSAFSRRPALAFRQCLDHSAVYDQQLIERVVTVRPDLPAILSTSARDGLDMDKAGLAKLAPSP
jgi:hypothetical protein